MARRVPARQITFRGEGERCAAARSWVCRLPSHTRRLAKARFGMRLHTTIRGGSRHLKERLRRRPTLLRLPGTEKWPSGRRRRPAKALRGESPPSRVRIPPSPPRPAPTRRRPAMNESTSALMSRWDAEDWEYDEETGGLVHLLRADDAVQAGLWKPGETAGRTIELELVAHETVLVLAGTGTL